MKAKLFSFLSIFFFALLGQSLYAQFTNKGNLVISNGFSLVVKNMNFVNDGTVTMKNDGKLYMRGGADGGDFVNNGTFGDSNLTETYQVIFDGTADQEIKGTTEPYIYELVTAQTGDVSVTQTINVSTYKINVGDAGNLFDYRVKDPANSGIRLTADEFVLNGNLRLYDDSQILQKTTGITVSGDGKLYRDQMGTGNKYWYNFWCSPVNVNGEWKLGGNLYDGRDPENPQPIYFEFDNSHPEGSPEVNSGQNPAHLNAAWIYKLEDNIDDPSSWQYVGDSAAVNIGVGYTMKGPNIFNATRPGSSSTTNTEFKAYTFAGKPNGGTYTFSIGNNHLYLLGNPYPSALDANELINDNDGEFNGTIYFWEHVGGDSHYTNDYVGGYAHYNLSGGTPARDWQTNDEVGTKTPGRYIPVAQGFFLYNDTGNTGTITIQNSQRVFEKEDGSNSVFMRSALTDIRLMFVDNNNLGRELLLAVRPNTSTGFDWGWDGPFVKFGYMTDMSFRIGNKDYVIQAIPEITDQTRLPLHIVMTEDGNIKIQVNELQNVPQDIDMYIEDVYNSTYNPVSLTQDYETYLQAGDYTDRFYLVFRSSSLKTDETATGNFGIYYNDGYVYITNPGQMNVQHPVVFDLNGKAVVEADLNTNEQHIKIPVSLATGIYMLQVQANGKNYVQKFIVE